MSDGRPTRPPGATVGPHPGYTPREWYTSQKLLGIESRMLFERSWSLVGTTDQLAEPGAYLTTTVGSSPLVVAAGFDGELRAFQNVCRHRGLPLVADHGRCGRFLTCPYHQWSYDLQGHLCNVPQSDEQFPGLDRSLWGLLPASVDTWHRMVFVNPDPHAPSLRTTLGELGRRLEHFVGGPLHQVACVSYEVDCNWKLIVENHIDVYHLWYVHKKSLEMYEHKSFCWEFHDDNWWSFEPLKEAHTGDPGGIPWLDDAESIGIGAHLLFPNLMLVTSDRYFATYDAVPVSPIRTRLTLRVRSMPDADGESLVASVRSFLAEDISICERLQQAVGSISFGLGPLAQTHEAPIVRFHQAIAARCHAG